MAETTFGIAYDGPALAAGKMPVRDLAPALLALGELFSEASQVVYPEGKPVALNIKATEEGSFVVHLILESEGAWDQFVDIFGGDAITALANLKALVIGGGTISLFGLLKFLAGREAKADDADTPGYVKLTVDDTTLEIPSEVWRMYRRVSIRRKAKEIVAPLTREGVDVVKFGETPTADPEVVIEKADLPAFDVPVTDDEVLLDDEREMVVEIASVSFEGRKWRLGDGEQTFFATVEDQEFLERVETGNEKFAQGDMLRCRMRVVQTQKVIAGLHTDYFVTKVIQHIPRQTQLSIGQ